MRAAFSLGASALTLILLAGCVPSEPEMMQETRTGLESYPEYQRRVAAEQRAAAQSAPSGVANYTSPYPDATGAPMATTDIANPIETGTPTGAPTAAELAQAGVSGAAGLAGASAPQPAAAYPSTLPAPAATYAPGTGPAIGTLPAAGAEPAANHAGISDENDFSAVSSRESIESDKQRIERNKANYQVVQPTALPQRTGDTGVSEIVQYAIAAQNRLGEPVYERSGSPEKQARNCAKYATAEDAQAAFLKAGGPKRDPKGLDSDGDGFACAWDPTPFQKARD